MANIIQMSNGDKTLVLGQREALVYPLPYDDWTDVRVGAFVSLCPPSGDFNHSFTDLSAQVIAVGGPSDSWYFGLKNNNNNLPGENGESFVGWSQRSGTQTVTNQHNSSYAIFGGGTATDNVSTVAILPNGQHFDFADLNYFYFNGDNFVSSGEYAVYMGVRLTVLNKGTSTQKIRVSRLGGNPGDGVTDTSDQELRNHLASNYTAPQDYDFQVGGVPLPLPNCLFAYSPFTKSQFRIHNIGALKAS